MSPITSFGASHITTTQTLTDKPCGWNKRETPGLQSCATVFYSEIALGVVGCDLPCMLLSKK